MSVGKAVSMFVLRKIHETDINDRQNQHNLKKKLKEWFPDLLLFLTTKTDTAETVVIAKNVSSYVFTDNKSCVIETGEMLMGNRNVYGKIFYATANSYHRHLGYQ